MLSISLSVMALCSNAGNKARLTSQYKSRGKLFASVPSAAFALHRYRTFKGTTVEIKYSALPHIHVIEQKVEQESPAPFSQLHVSYVLFYVRSITNSRSFNTSLIRKEERRTWISRLSNLRRRMSNPKTPLHRLAPASNYGEEYQEPTRTKNSPKRHCCRREETRKNTGLQELYRIPP